MANKQKATNQDKEQQPGDPLFNLKHAQAEAELLSKTGDLSGAVNDRMSDDQEEEIDAGPRDSQGQRRGEIDDDRIGSNAGSHQ